ncbi:hypothetical protein COO03_00970 [Bacillus sp. AFS098217]|nr:hypothetical protein COO03_00970 [Bacillus sp. AFS098217]
MSKRYSTFRIRKKNCLHLSIQCKEPRKLGSKLYINPLFLGGREDLAMHRSGQGLFLPHAK